MRRHPPLGDRLSLGDIIRQGLTLQPATGTAFPGGGTYGSSVCLPLPDVLWLNNPVVP